MMTIFVFILALGILVLVHEWGHFIVAKKSGVRVDIFSIGFGPKILGFRYGGTDYRVAPIPLGGYVKIFGQDPMEEAGGDPARAQEIARDPQSFSSKSAWQKLATVLAGPGMNLVLCLLLMPLVFMLGRMQPKIYQEKPVVIDVEDGSPAAQAGLQKDDLILSFNDKPVDNWQELMTQISLHPESAAVLEIDRSGTPREIQVQLIQNVQIKQSSGYLGIEPFAFVGNEPVVDQVNAGSPAAQAGIQKGDRIVAINGQPVKYWTKMTETVQKSEGQPLEILVDRQGEEVSLTAAAHYNQDLKTWVLGITKMIDMSHFVKKRHGFADAIILGTQENVKLFQMTLDVLKRLFTGDLSYKSLGGPIQIAQATSMAARSGVGEFIYLLAFLSMQLGIMNLLPIPVLDGGHVVLMGIEAIRKKPLSPRVRQLAMQAGMFALLGLMVMVTINDIDSVWGFANILQSLKNIF